MSGPIHIHDGDLAIKDPADSLVYTFNWGDVLTAGVTIANGPDFTIEAVKPVSDTSLTKDEESHTEAGLRTTRLRLTAGTHKAVYRISNRIITNEVPAQTVERSFLLLVEEQ